MGKHPSCPFNPLLANAFFRAGYIESWGRGVEKIQRECREHGIELPVYDFGMAGLMLTFRANPAHLQAAVLEQGTALITTQETTQETVQEKVLALVRAQPSITRRELASRLGLSDSGIKYHLEKMKAAGVIRHLGATKSGSWEVLK